MRLVCCVLAGLAAADAFNLPNVPRREVLRIGATTLITPFLAVSPASASKSKLKDDMTKFDQITKNEISAATGLAAGSAGKGSRGSASAEFDKKDTVVQNRLKNNGGLAFTPDGKKIVNAQRSRPPEELGLKQWSGN